MALTLNRAELHRLARVGAQARLEQLERERALILRAFPGLEAGGQGSFPAGTPASRPRRRTMSAAQRKAVSARMRKYWAARRKEKAAK